MHERTNIQLSAADRRELEAVAANRNSPQKHVWRAKMDTSINGLLLAGSRVVGGLWLPIFAWSELASAEWLALGI